MIKGRKLFPKEAALGRSVFGDTVPYDRVIIGDLELGSAVTKAGWDLRGKRWVYEIFWPDIFVFGPRSPQQEAVLIHELVHVWQGENGSFPHAYMGQSALAQTTSGIRDIVKSRKWRGWGNHRSTAYDFKMNDIGKKWSEFNVEQQGNIVESWFIKEADRRNRGIDFGEGVSGGGASRQDARFPYIRDVIRARDRHAAYRPVQPVRGADPQVKMMQDKLVALGYLDAGHADGTIGRTRSATLDAVQAFQSRNGLKADRDLGGPNSMTRRKLALTTAQLAPAANTVGGR